MIAIPINFNGLRFALKFNLNPITDFHVENGILICPSLPNLTEADLADCVLDLAMLERVRLRYENAKLTAKNIPAWATWTQAQWAEYFNGNLSDEQADLVTTLAAARVMIKRQNVVINALAKMVIALRDDTWSDLPEA